MKEEKQILRTEIFSGKFGNFFVSTMKRRSSGMLDTFGMYYETLAWGMNDKNERENIVADNSGALTGIRAEEQHFEVCRQLRTTGEFKENFNEED